MTASPRLDHRAAGPVRCPECGERALLVPPTDWPLRDFMATPAASHTDGTALCPVPGPYGSQPAEPISTPTARTHSAHPPATPPHAPDGTPNHLNGQEIRT